jgi:hypothetical protein
MNQGPSISTPRLVRKGTKRIDAGMVKLEEIPVSEKKRLSIAKKI